MYYNRMFTVIWVFTYLQAYVSFLLIHLDGILLLIVIHQLLLVGARVKPWERNVVKVTSVSAFWATNEDMNERQKKRTWLHLPVRDRHPSRLPRVNRQARVSSTVWRAMKAHVMMPNPINATYHLHRL